MGMQMARLGVAATVAAIVIAGAPLPAAAQEEGPSKQEIMAFVEAARAEMRASREQLIAANLPMTDAEAAGFWPLYREYNTKKASLGDERLQIILDYAAKYPDVDDATAKSLVDRSVKYRRKLNKLEESYVSKFGKILPPVKLMRFLQIDDRIDNLVELEVQQGIPIVEAKQ